MIKKILKTIFITIITFLLSFVLVQSLIVIEQNRNYVGKVDYVIVLGARLYGDIPSPTLVNRLDSALEYLEQFQDVSVVVAGGQGPNETITEALAMSRYLKDKGIKSERILIEEKSDNTFENLKYSIDIINNITLENDLKILIVSSDYHLFRAKMIAKQFGFDIYTKGSPVPPSVLSKAYIREYFAIFKSFIFDRI